jgi:hypothetical protein
MAAAGVIHRDDESVRVGQLFEQRICQMRHERRNAALARQVVSERRESPDLICSAHTVARRAVPTAGTDTDRSSSAILFKAARLNPCASRAMSRSPSRSRRGTRRSRAATSSSRT